MCKQCELDGIRMPMTPLDRATIAEIPMPKSWLELEEKGFPHPDLALRACAHMAWITREAAREPAVGERWLGNAKAFVSAMAKGFMAEFDPTQFPVEPDDPHMALKTNALTAICALAQEFGNRVPSVMWDALAHLSTRQEPLESRSILREADSLPHHFGVVDTMLHAMGKVYTFSLRVQAVFFAHTGMVLVHNCDCNCSLLNLKEVKGGSIVFDLTAKERHEATQSLFTHMLAESHLILDQHLPFEYTITEEGKALFG